MTAAKGFREGGFNPLLIGTEFEAYPIDELWSYEIGYKTRFSNGRGSLDVAAYYIDVTAFNGAANVPTPAGLRTVTVPIGEVESYGIELATTYALNENFLVSFTGGTNIAEPTELDPRTSRPTAQEGEQLPAAPEWTARLEGIYTATVFDDMYFRFTLGASGVGPTNFSGAELPTRPALVTRDSYYLFDANASLEWDRYTVSAFIQNAGDETYADGYLDQEVLGAYGATSSGVYYGQQQYFGMSLRVAL